MVPPWQDEWVQHHSVRLIRSFRHWTGQELMSDIEPSQLGTSPLALAQQLFTAPQVIVSHDNQPDPRFNYANQMALDLWETTWDQWVGFPSRLSAAPAWQPERQHFLRQVQQRGWADNYQGIRITRQGKRFYIRNAIVWNVLDESGRMAGQAAMFSEWERLD